MKITIDVTGWSKEKINKLLDLSDDQGPFGNVCEDQQPEVNDVPSDVYLSGQFTKFVNTHDFLMNIRTDNKLTMQDCLFIGSQFNKENPSGIIDHIKMRKLFPNVYVAVRNGTFNEYDGEYYYENATVSTICNLVNVIEKVGMVKFLELCNFKDMTEMAGFCDNYHFVSLVNQIF